MIAFVTCNHGRESILELYCEGVKRLQQKHDIVSIIVGDENSVISNYDCIHVPYKNDPLTEKYNAGCLTAREFSPDYVCIMGSDNLFSSEILDQVELHTSSNFIGIRDIYFYALDGDHKGEMIYIVSSVVGCCRFLRADLMERVAWFPFKRERNKGIDQLLWQSTSPFFENPYIFIAKDYNGTCIDLKTEENINRFDKWKAMPRVDPEDGLKFLSDKEREMLRNILQ